MFKLIMWIITIRMHVREYNTISAFDRLIHEKN